MIISGESFLESRFVDRVSNVYMAFVALNPSNPRRPDLVILSLSLPCVPWCSLASLQWWQFFNRFGSLLLDLIVLVMTLPNVWAKNKFPTVACAYCCLFCLINYWSPVHFSIPPYLCRNMLLFSVVFILLNKQNLFGFMIWQYKDIDLCPPRKIMLSPVLCMY